MSGIFGILHKHPAARASVDELAPMTATMALWGPDGMDLLAQGPLACGHALLAHPDRPGEAPKVLVAPAHPHCLIVADASLDERDELCAALGLPPASTTERDAQPDAQLLLAAWARWGEDCVQHLKGSFAFAIWDAGQRRLFCARDALGLRPLYYWDGPGHFVFATDLRAVLAVPGVPRERDPEMLMAQLMNLHARLAARSCYRDVHRLAPAHALSVGPAESRLRRWWQPLAGPVLRLPRLDDYIEALRAELDRAIAQCLPRQGAVGCHLSGGLDSSAITVLAARQRRRQGLAAPIGYSWSPGSEAQEPVAEGRLIAQVCAQEGLECRFTDLSEADILAVVARDFTLEPLETVVFEQQSCRQAAADGVQVILSGWGGDECVTHNGRGYFAELLAAGRWPTLLRELRQTCAPGGGSVLRLGLARAVLPWLPARLQRLAFARSGSARRAREGLALLARQDAAMARLAGALLDERFDQEREATSVNASRLQLLANGHLALRAEAWAWLGARHRVHYRYPYLDRRLLEFCLRLPADLAYRDGWKRFLYRQACTGILPPEIAWARLKSDPASAAALRGLSEQVARLDRPTDPDPVIQQSWQFFQLLRGLS